MDHVKPFLAGSLAGVVTKTATAPLERIKTLLQVEGMAAQREAAKRNLTGDTATRLPTKRGSSGIVNTFTRILARDGVKGFWYGNAANCLRVIPVYALKFGLNDNIKDFVRPAKGVKLTYLQLVASGTLAGLIQMCTTYPLETVRTRLTVGAAHGAKYDGIWHCFADTVKHEGIGGLYKGLSPTILSGSPYVGLQMSGYEILTRKADQWGIFGGNKVFESSVCGAVAGMIAQIITYPGDTVRKRMQTDGIRGAPKMYVCVHARHIRCLLYTSPSPRDRG